MQSFKIHVTKDYLSFCSGHFITYEGHSCERLHGHDYRVGVTLEGEISASWYIFDFVTLKKLMKQITDEIDHRVLLALNNPLLKISYDDRAISVEYKERRYLFPRDDVVLLPIPNTTAEMLAQYLTNRLKQQLISLQVENIHFIEIDVEESFGQFATYRETF